MDSLLCKGKFLWSPALSVADFALRKLEEAVHKRPDSFHVFISTKLMLSVSVNIALQDV